MTIVAFIGGESGTGKTSLARKLASTCTGCVLLDKDPATWALSENILINLKRPRHDRSSRDYLTKVRPFEYATLTSLLEENLPYNHHIVVCAPFLKEMTVPDWVASTRSNLHRLYGAQSLFIWMSCDLATAKSRIFKRSATRDVSKMQDWEAYARRVTACPENDPNVICLDSSSLNLSEEVARRVLPLWKPA